MTFGNFNIIRLNHSKLLVFDYFYIKRNGDFGLKKTDKMTLIRGNWGHTPSATSYHGLNLLTVKGHDENSGLI